jgi:hypothetical protein
MNVWVWQCWQCGVMPETKTRFFATVFARFLHNIRDCTARPQGAKNSPQRQAQRISRDRCEVFLQGVLGNGNAAITPVDSTDNTSHAPHLLEENTHDGGRTEKQELCWYAASVACLVFFFSLSKPPPPSILVWCSFLCSAILRGDSEERQRRLTLLPPPCLSPHPGV